MNQHTFVKNALSLLGLTYNQCDCIGVIRKAANIRCEGTNWLWRSISNSPKYRYLIERSTKPLNPALYEDGLLLFRIKENVIPPGYSDPPDCHHVGVLGLDSGEWCVIQSNPGPGVYCSKFNPDEWDGWGRLKQIEYGDVPGIPDTVPEPDPENPMSELEYIMEIHRMVKVLYDAYMRGMD